MNDINVNISKKVFLPCYHHLLQSPYDIDLLWGGRDSGKSRDIAQQLIMDCLRLPYFRCVLLRKVFNTIKESQWQLIKDVAEEWKVDHLFTFTQAPLEIRCVNGNKFICRGMDEPGRLKSISNPSHAWAEEANQLELNDFIVMLTTLRYSLGKVKVWMSFNPECDGDFEEFWIFKTFFTDKNQRSFDGVWKMPVGPHKRLVSYTYQCTHTTYNDNRYCSDERAAILEHLANLDPYYYQVFTLGMWGLRKINDPFCYCYVKDKHVKRTTLNPMSEVYLSFDFNVNPITCGVYQHYHDRILGIESIKLPNSDIYKLCEHIKVKYGNCMFLVTGDATGQATNALVQDGINYYTVIMEKLNLAPAQLKVPPQNPRVEENRMLVNAAFHDGQVELDPEGCKGLIFDCEYVSVDDMGKIEKGDRKNPKKRADHLDNFRYYLNTFQRHLLRL
jgi:PBSX family phage terminase large subunit